MYLLCWYLSLFVHIQVKLLFPTVFSTTFLDLLYIFYLS